jgi:hypothetical protein
MEDPQQPPPVSSMTSHALPSIPIEPDEVMEPPSGMLGELNELLKRPAALVRRSYQGGPAPARLMAGALACFVLYGVAAGFFAGGASLLLAAFKVPLIILLTFLLCVPSLYVFGAMAGAEWTGRRFLTLLSGFAATLGLLLVALLPISWLFSVSSRYLASAVWLHFFLWALALIFGWRFLDVALRESGSKNGLFLWLVLFLLVSMQVATVVRPVLVWEEGSALFVQGKMFFLEHLGRVYDEDEKARQVERKREEDRKRQAEAKKVKAKPAAVAPTTPGTSAAKGR